MIASHPQVTDILIVQAGPTAGKVVSLGLILDSGAGWGDLLLPAAAEPQAALEVISYLKEFVAPALRGQRPEGFGEFCALGRAALGNVSSFIVPREYITSFQAALQQAYLDALSRRQAVTLDAVINQEYKIAGDRPPAALILEVSDYAATAERIDWMLGLRPAGLGYRITVDQVVESIGEDAQFLQRFVRQMGRRADMLAMGEAYRPAMFLSLNGGLGQLAGDPVRHIGKVLGNIVGLQTAAGERRLILQEPFLLDELVAQVSNLNRLKDFIRRAPDSLKRSEPTLLVAQGSGLSDDEVTVYTDTEAVHLLSFDPLFGGDLDWMLRSVGRARAAGLDVILRLGAAATPRWAFTLASLAEAVRPMAVVASCDEPASGIPELFSRLLAESAAQRSRG